MRYSSLKNVKGDSLIKLPLVAVVYLNNTKETLIKSYEKVSFICRSTDGFIIRH